jgi:hypothetical protein
MRGLRCLGKTPGFVRYSGYDTPEQEAEYLPAVGPIWIIGDPSPGVGPISPDEMASTISLQIPWPMLVDGGPVPLDLLLATVTDPQIGALGKSDYPSPKAIADEWNRSPAYAYYFHNNRLAGIETAEDAEIRKFLSKGPLPIITR